MSLRSFKMLSMINIFYIYIYIYVCVYVCVCVRVCVWFDIK